MLSGREYHHMVNVKRHRTGDSVVLLGPGGFTAGEFAAAQEAGFESVHLGPHALRVETAAITVVSLFRGCGRPVQP